MIIIFIIFIIVIIIIIIIIRIRIIIIREPQRAPESTRWPYSAPEGSESLTGPPDRPKRAPREPQEASQ
eukprot:8967485-Karenia_brevis.AAC.1